MRYYYTSSKMAEMKNSDTANSAKGAETTLLVNM
jgi:hypothetical protein